MFAIEDEAHAELIGDYANLQDAMAELHRRAAAPWDEAPNLAPCTAWRTCGREYEIVEYDGSGRELGRTPALKVSAEGAQWRLGS
jgi:hypothetical protein